MFVQVFDTNMQQSEPNKRGYYQPKRKYEPCKPEPKREREATNGDICVRCKSQKALVGWQSSH